MKRFSHGCEVIYLCVISTSLRYQEDSVLQLPVISVFRVSAGAFSYNKTALVFPLTSERET